MNDDEILDLLDDITKLAASSSGVTRIEVETEDFAVAVTCDPSAVAAPSVLGPRAAATADRPKTQRVHASTVGIFSAAKTWSTGDDVKRGAVLGAIQSLGHMAEVTAPADGEIAEVLVAAGAPVEYGQPLFAIAVRA